MFTPKELYNRRKLRTRYKIRQSNKSNRPRLCVHRTNCHLYAQIIDDSTSSVLVSFSTLDKEAESFLKSGNNINAAKYVGQKIGQKALEKGLKQIIFDRSGYMYHGRIKAIADSAREAGLTF